MLMPDWFFLEAPSAAFVKEEIVDRRTMQISHAYRIASDEARRSLREKLRAWAFKEGNSLEWMDGPTSAIVVVHPPGTFMRPCNLIEDYDSFPATCPVSITSG